MNKKVVSKNPEDILAVDFLGMNVYEKGNTLMESKIFGIPLRFIALAGVIYYVLRKQL